MSKVRYSVRVYADRGTGPYSYVQHERLRPGKVADAVVDTAVDILRHETRSGLTGSITYGRLGATVIVYGPETYCKFVVKAWRV